MDLTFRQTFRLWSRWTESPGCATSWLQSWLKQNWGDFCLDRVHEFSTAGFLSSMRNFHASLSITKSKKRLHKVNRTEHFWIVNRESVNILFFLDRELCLFWVFQLNSELTRVIDFVTGICQFMWVRGRRENLLLTLGLLHYMVRGLLLLLKRRLRFAGLHFV
jgi:hypothetical protein